MAPFCLWPLLHMQPEGFLFDSNHNEHIPRARQGAWGGTSQYVWTTHIHIARRNTRYSTNEVLFWHCRATETLKSQKRRLVSLLREICNRFSFATVLLKYISYIKSQRIIC